MTTLEHTYLSANQSDSGYEHLGKFDYAYDDASNVLSALQNETMGHLDVDRHYRYDTLNRLTGATLHDDQAWAWIGPDPTTSYQYDELGNRESHVYRGIVSPPTVTYAHDKANRMTTLNGNSQGYDLAGNQTVGYSADRGTSYVYKYDHNNGLTGIYDDGGTNRSAAFAYDALGRRIEFINDKLGTTSRYYYDGMNEIVEVDDSDNNVRTYVHGISYVDERLMMRYEDNQPYYTVIDRMYDVVALVDRAGALVERYCYDPYGRPLIRESAGRGDMDSDTDMDGTDSSRVTAAKNGTIWDPRADMDDDGDVDAADETAYATKDNSWPPQSSPTVAQAFSDLGNPFMHQGRPHFALDTASNATEGTLMLNDHRARFNDPVIGRWLTRDPLDYSRLILLPIDPLMDDDSDLRSYFERSQLELVEDVGVEKYYDGAAVLYLFERSNPTVNDDPLGLFCPPSAPCNTPASRSTGCTPSHANCSMYLPMDPVSYGVCRATSGSSGSWSNCVRGCIQRCICAHPWYFRWGAPVFCICHADCFLGCRGGGTPIW